MHTTIEDAKGSGRFIFAEHLAHSRAFSPPFLAPRHRLDHVVRRGYIRRQRVLSPPQAR